MPIDNILYDNDFVLDVDIMSTGAISNILFKESKMVNVNIVHTGGISSMLFSEGMMETVTLICDENTNTYSRSRVVNK